MVALDELVAQIGKLVGDYRVGRSHEQHPVLQALGLGQLAQGWPGNAGPQGQHLTPPDPRTEPLFLQDSGNDLGGWSGL